MPGSQEPEASRPAGYASFTKLIWRWNKLSAIYVLWVNFTGLIGKWNRSSANIPMYNRKSRPSAENKIFFCLQVEYNSMRPLLIMLRGLAPRSQRPLGRRLCQFHKIDREMEQIVCNICPMCQFHKIDREMEQIVCNICPMCKFHKIDREMEQIVWTGTGGV